MACADLDHEEHVQAPQRDRTVHMEEAAGQHGHGLGVQELPPRFAIALRCGLDLHPLQDPPHRGRADLVAHAEQFALDSLVAPARVLPRQLLDQRHDLSADRRTAATTPGMGPSPTDHSPVPAEQRVRRHQTAFTQCPWHQPGQGGEHGTVSPVQPRFRVRPPQHHNRVAQHQQFGVLRRRRPGQQRQPPSHADKHQI